MAAEKVINAFRNGGNKCKEKHDFTEGFKYYYRGNCIAWIDFNDDLWVDSCGWMTNTTKNRLSRIGCKLQQVKGKWYLKGKEWDGKQINYSKL